MRRFKVTTVAIAALAILMATNAMAADPNVDSMLAIEYDNGVFAAAVLAGRLDAYAKAACRKVPEYPKS